MKTDGPTSYNSGLSGSRVPGGSRPSQLSALSQPLPVQGPRQGRRVRTPQTRYAPCASARQFEAEGDSHKEVLPWN